MLLRYQLSPSEANNSVFVPLSGPICAVQSVHAVKEKVHRCRDFARQFLGLPDFGGKWVGMFGAF